MVVIYIYHVAELIPPDVAEIVLSFSKTNADITRCYCWLSIELQVNLLHFPNLFLTIPFHNHFPNLIFILKINDKLSSAKYVHRHT